MALTMSSGAKDKQRRQIGAFAAGKKLHTTNDEGNGKLRQPSAKPQDRGRLKECPGGDVYERSRYQTTSTAFYNKSLDDVTTHGAHK